MQPEAFERFLLSESAERSQPAHYGAQLIPDLIRRGDDAVKKEDWVSAENCYIAAYFVNGGRGQVIRAKLEMVKQIINLSSLVEDADRRVVTARYSRRALETVWQELVDAAYELGELRHELPDSLHLRQLDKQLSEALHTARDLLA